MVSEISGAKHNRCQQQTWAFLVTGTARRWQCL